MENLQENENYKLGFEAGQKASIERFKNLQRICGEDNELLGTAFVEGRNLAEITEQRIVKLSDTNVQLAWQIRVSQFMSENNCSEAAATDKCVDLYPELHKKMSGR